MKPLHLRFESKQHAHSALLANGFELAEGGELTHKMLDVYEVGVIHGAITTDNDGNVTHRDPDVDGYHINLLAPNDYSHPFLHAAIEVKTPHVRWAGY